jgi:hypothetical protein
VWVVYNGVVNKSKLNNMNRSKGYLFFDSKAKKNKKMQVVAPQHSRSLSSKSEIAKNSARAKISSHKLQPCPLTKK